MKANRLILNKKNELIADYGNTWAPIGSFSTTLLLEALTTFGANTIQVKFRTHEAFIEQDKDTYTKRMQKLSPFFLFTGWKPQEIDGHIHHNILVGTLQRAIWE